MKTFAEWQQSNVSFHQFVEEGEDIDSEMYYYFMSVVPPTFVSPNGGFFLAGEADGIDGEETLYSSFFICGCDKYAYGGLMPLSECV